MSQLPPDPEEPSVEYARVWAEAIAIAKGEILTAETPNLKLPDAVLTVQLEHSIRLFKRAMQLKPGNWQAMWFAGKIQQRLRNHKEALFWFERAYEVNDSRVEISRELSTAACHLGKSDLSIRMAARAVELDRDSANLSSLALAYLLAGKLSDAKATILESLECDPSDKISIAILKMVEHFLRKRRIPPNRTQELEKYWRLSHKWYRRWAL
jgi:tetratricopeptide (TPR) repeat protein